MRVLVQSGLAAFATVVALSAASQSFPPSGEWTALRGKASADSAVVHRNAASLRVESSGADAWVKSKPVSLQIGRQYEIQAWVKTQDLQVRDVDRTPIAVGAHLTMASMPLDMRSESLGSTHDWTELRLRFTATRSRDHIVLAAATGGAFSGKAWFSDVAIEEIGGTPSWPAKAAVTTLGPAYRYPTGGWIYLHIEGKPYERGYQHGYLMAKEIESYVDRCAAHLDSKSRQSAWENGRSMANALFLRGFDQEILEEMKGIADGAAAAGGKYSKRKIDLDDIVAANTITELRLLRAATRMTPSGLEGLNFRRPDYVDPQRADVPVTERCSAFAATGKATADGHMMVAHITMWSLTLAEQTNIMLDVKPATGRRVLMQAYPGGIQSGTDWYQNDAGVVLTETTIRQSPFNINGTPVAYRARKAIQYGENVDKVVEHLGTKNNGLYTNEWLIGDAKNDEIAMYELGTHKTKLWRSSKNEWFAGTEGFYWGCNNAKDLDVRLEYVPDRNGAPENLPFVPADRDIKWQELYERWRGKIDEQFAFLAFRTAPLVSSSAFDAKIATAEMASKMQAWAVFGKPNEREWVPSAAQKDQFAGNEGIYSSGYRLIDANLKVSSGEKAKAFPVEKPKPEKLARYEEKLWKGWLLPASDADLWLTAGSEAYHQILSEPEWEKALDANRAAYRMLARERDTPLDAIVTGTRSNHGARLARNKGALLFDALRREIGDDRFFALMRDFYAAQTTRRVSTRDFLTAAGAPLAPFFDRWLRATGLPGETAGPMYVAGDIIRRLRSAMIVYGTTTEAGANRYAAEQLQKRFLDSFESAVPVVKDFDALESELKSHDIVFVGRPETNSVLSAWRDKLGLDYSGATFRLDGEDRGSESQGIVLAFANPLDDSRMALVFAGNSALETVRVARTNPGSWEYAYYEAGKQKTFGFRKR